MFYSDLITILSRHLMKLISKKHMNKIKCCHFETKDWICFKFAEKTNIINSFSKTLTVVTCSHSSHVFTRHKLIKTRGLRANSANFMFLYEY